MLSRGIAMELSHQSHRQGHMLIRPWDLVAGKLSEEAMAKDNCIESIRDQGNPIALH